MDSRPLILLGAIGALAWLALRPQSAYASSSWQNPDTGGGAVGEPPIAAPDGGFPDWGSASDPWGYIEPATAGEVWPGVLDELPAQWPIAPGEPYPRPVTDNVGAFLATIRAAEGTDPNRYGQDPYRVVYGFSHIIESLDDHPTNTGEWGPVAGPAGPTSAAGAYQITRSTWNTVVQPRALAAFGRRLTFEPADQDAAAVILLQYRGAYEPVISGYVDGALIQRLAPEWDSFRVLGADRVLALYSGAGGGFV